MEQTKVMAEHKHDFSQPLLAAFLSNDYPNCVVYYHCRVADCDEGICEVEEGYEL